jgi:Winged helix-turn-helix DNA-binding
VSPFTSAAIPGGRRVEYYGTESGCSRSLRERKCSKPFSFIASVVAMAPCAEGSYSADDLRGLRDGSLTLDPGRVDPASIRLWEPLAEDHWCLWRQAGRWWVLVGEGYERRGSLLFFDRLPGDARYESMPSAPIGPFGESGHCAEQSGHCYNPDLEIFQEDVLPTRVGSEGLPGCNSVPIRVGDRREAYRPFRTGPFHGSCEGCGAPFAPGEAAWKRPDWRYRRSHLPLVVCGRCHASKGGPGRHPVLGMRILATVAMFDERGASSSEIADALGISDRTVKRRLRDLVSRGALISNGRARATRYTLAAADAARPEESEPAGPAPGLPCATPIADPDRNHGPPVQLPLRTPVHVEEA